MAVAYTMVKQGVAGNMRINVVDVNLDAAYVAGGYTLSAASLGVGTIHALIPVVKATDGIVATWDVTNSKLKVYKGSNTTTVTAGNGELTELATNDTILNTSTVVRCTVIADNITG